MSVGVVFGVSSVTHNGEQQHFVSYVSFDDIGGPGLVRVGGMWPVGRRGAVHPSQYYGQNASKRYQPTVTRPAPFRVVELTLPPGDAPIVWSGPPLLSLVPVRAALVRTRGFVNDHPADLVDRIEAGYSHRIGLVVSGGAISVRSVRITPPSSA